MSNYFTLVKLLLKNTFKRDKSQKSSKAKWALYIVLALSYLVVAASIMLMIYLYALTFDSLGMRAEFITVIYIIGIVFVLIFGIISMLSTLYFSRDSEFFLALPIKPGTVYMAKLTSVYLGELATTALILVPCLIATGVTLGVGWIYYVTAVIAILLVPAVPLFLSSLLAIPLMYVVSFFKKRGAASSVAMILLFGTVFALYYVFIMQFSSTMAGGEADVTAMVEKMRGLFIGLSNAFYPLYALAKAAIGAPFAGMGVGVSSLLNFLIFFGSVAALAGLAYVISSAVYRRGVAGQLESSENKNRKAAYESSGVTVALMKREWREMLRTPTFAFQCLSGIVLTPIVLVFMTMMNKTTGTEGIEGTEVFAKISWFISVGILLMFGVGMNIGAATAVTREGDKYYYAKLIPVDYKTQVRAKGTVYFLITAVTVVLSVVVTSIMDFSPLRAILALFFLLIYGYGFNHFAVFFDLLHPKLDWVSPKEAMKRSRNASLPMLINMAVSVAVVAVAIALTVILPSPLGEILGWVFLFAFSIAAAFVFHFLLYKKCDALYERL